MNRIEFVKTIVESSEFDNRSDFECCFYNAVLKRWLKENRPLRRENGCENCHRFNSKPGEAMLEAFRKGLEPVRLTCEAVQQEGVDCYKEMLRTKFIPFVKDALNDVCPEPTTLHEVIFSSTGAAKMTLKGVIEHELTGMFHKMHGEGCFKNKRPSLKWFTKEVRKSKAKKKG
jgi:hypothetical protein